MLLASGIAGLGDFDPYRHLAYAGELWRSGFALRGFPFLPFTTLGDTGVDLWWGFHLLMVPFSALGVLWGARLAGTCIAAVVAGSAAWLLARLGQPRAAWFAVAPLAFSFSYAYRDHLARPAHLTIPLVFCAVAAGAGELAVPFVFVASVLHALLHLSAPVLPLFALAGLAGARFAGGRGQPDAVLWSVGGLGLGWLLRPDRALYLPVAFLLDRAALSAANGSARTAEMLPLPAADLLFETWAGLVLLGLSIWLGRGKLRAGSRPMRGATAVAAAATLLLTLRSARFLDYAAPMVALCAGLWWPVASLRSRAPRLAIAGLVAAFGLLAVRNVRLAWEEGAATGPPSLYEGLAAAVRARVAPGAMLFTDDPFRTSAVYASLPDYRYVTMIDPAFLFTASPLDYYRWLHAVRDGQLCERPSCPGQFADPRGLARAISTFGAEWIITSLPARSSAQVRTMLAAPEQFEPVYASQVAEAGFVLWRLNRLSPRGTDASPPR